MRIQKSLYGFDEIDAAIRQASQADVDDAYRTAAAAQPGWAAQTPAERTAVLTRAADYVETHRDQLAALLSAESGSTAAKAGVELQLVVNSIREAATFPTRVHGKIMPSNTPGKENRVYREPVGVVGVISPWNFPMILSMRSVAPALAVGNAVVLKPASDTPLSGGLVIAKIFEAAGLPAGARAAVLAKFLHQGQICMSTNRIIVEAPVYDAFITRFTEIVGHLKYGDTANLENLVGPIINDDQVASVVGKIERARAEGARQVVTGPVEGRVVAPRVFADVTPDMELFREEIFGPVVGIVKASDEEHALRLANDTVFGLSSSVFTQDLDRGVRFARRIKAGMTHINDITVNDEAHVMFGGEKNSGLGRFNGDWAIEEFTTDHWIGVMSAPLQLPF